MKIYKRDDKWGVDYKNPITGKRMREVIGTNKKQAEDRLAKIRSEKMLYNTYGEKEYFANINKQTKQIRFSEMVTIYLEWAKSNKKSADRDRLSLSHWENFLVPPQRKVKFADMYLSEIIVKMIEDYKTERLRQIKPVAVNLIEKKTIKPATINRELACLKTLFSKAIEWGYTRENPVKKVKMFKEDNSRVRYLTQEEIDDLLKACGTLTTAKYLKPIVIVALNTGMRKTEILNLKWKNIDFPNNLIYIETSKNGEGAYITMNNTVKETLKNLSPIYELQNGSTVVSEYVFRGRNGDAQKSIRNSFEKAVKMARIEDFKFHDTRHSFASHLVMNGVDLVTVKELMRHKTIAMTLRYAHLSPKHKKEAVESLYKKKDGTNMAQVTSNQYVQKS
ncbi:MAG: tyrosine-type recombinase/integrase [Candidatus Firestonebacteria bacterium]